MDGEDLVIDGTRGSAVGVVFGVYGDFQKLPGKTIAEDISYDMTSDTLVEIDGTELNSWGGNIGDWRTMVSGNTEF